MFPTTQCRKCIRSQHSHEPFHRIECWTGKFYRPAAMWEVGGYVLIRHCGESHLCDTLKFQKDLLEDIQVEQDINDQETCRAAAAASINSDTLPRDRQDEWVGCNDEDEDRNRNDNDTDALILAEMDRLHSQQREIDEIEMEETLLDDEKEEGEKECGDEAFTGFKEYLGSTSEEECAPDASMSGAAAASTFQAPFESSALPKKDAFNNHYVRIAHSNGIHHIGVVTCLCRGVDQIPIDFMYSRLVPTSFSTIRTLFTTMALDTFRLANLEMKASAYQYFQFIHRLTSKITSNVPNLYHDLRKLSRAWRWMKKLKWAGFAHKSVNSNTPAADNMNPAAGGLSIFCPACPQPNINLPDDWKSDRNR